MFGASVESLGWIGVMSSTSPSQAAVLRLAGADREWGVRVRPRPWYRPFGDAGVEEVSTGS